MSQKKDQVATRERIHLFAVVAFICGFLAVLLIGIGQWLRDSVRDATRFARSDAFGPFTTGLFAGAFITGTIVWLILRREHERKHWLLRREYECYRGEFQGIKLEWVIVEPMKEHHHLESVSPERRPVAAQINGKRYKAGDQVTENLRIWVMTDEGATSSPGDFEGYTAEEPAVQLDGHTFHGAALTDEWEVTIACFPRHGDAKARSNPEFCFWMTTNRARYEDGSDASLSHCRAAFVDGRQIRLPRQRKRHRQFTRRPDGTLEEVEDSPSNPHAA